MSRRTLGQPASLAVSLAAAALIGCSATPEQPVLNQFFAASRLRDNTALASFATASFEPNVEGTVTGFEITHVAPERRDPFTGSKLVAEGSESSNRVGDSRRSPASQSLVVDLSINAGAAAPLDIARHDGDLASKDISISAQVRLPDGRTAPKQFVVTFQRAVLKADHEIVGRWIVTAIRDAPGSPATPRS